MKKEKPTIQENIFETGVLPEFINGIPTAKHRSRERRSLIAKYYSNLWKKLQKEGRKSTVFNDYLGVCIYIVENECNKKTTGTQTKNGYKNMAILYYSFTNKAIPHLDFKVKLTIGIRADNKHVQYCINKIEAK